MTKINAHAITSGLAHDARQHQRSVEKIEIGQFRAVTEVPQHARPWTAFDAFSFRVDRKCRRAARNDARHRQTIREQLPMQVGSTGESRLAKRCSLRKIWLMKVTVINMQTVRRDPW